MEGRVCQCPIIFVVLNDASAAQIPQLEAAIAAASDHTVACRELAGSWMAVVGLQTASLVDHGQVWVLSLPP